jgi:hypothetical protein
MQHGDSNLPGYPDYPSLTGSTIPEGDKRLRIEPERATILIILLERNADIPRR